MKNTRKLCILFTSLSPRSLPLVCSARAPASMCPSLLLVLLVLLLLLILLFVLHHLLLPSGWTKGSQVLQAGRLGHRPRQDE